MAGAVIIGLHVKKTTQLLSQLLQQDSITGIDIAKIIEHRAQLLEDISVKSGCMYSVNKITSRV